MLAEKDVRILEVVTCARRTFRTILPEQHLWNVESRMKPPAVVDALIVDTLRSWFLSSLSLVFCRADHDDENGASGNAPAGRPLPFLHHKVTPPLVSSTPSRFDIHKRAQQKTGQALSPPHAPTSTPSFLPSSHKHNLNACHEENNKYKHKYNCTDVASSIRNSHITDCRCRRGHGRDDTHRHCFLPRNHRLSPAKRQHRPLDSTRLS